MQVNEVNVDSVGEKSLTASANSGGSSSGKKKNESMIKASSFSNGTKCARMSSRIQVT